MITSRRRSGALAGDGLKVGSHGMVAFYDKIIPQVVNDALKKTGGGKLERITLDPLNAAHFEHTRKTGDMVEQLGFAVTPAMRARVAEGLPLFSPLRKGANAINSTLTRIDAAVDGLSNLPDQFDYLSDRYLALGKIARVDEIITHDGQRDIHTLDLYQTWPTMAKPYRRRVAQFNLPRAALLRLAQAISENANGPA